MFINHVTTNPFFVPTQYGIEDAQALLGTTSQWTGSENSVVKDMVDQMNTAISGNADGIAVAVVSPTAFNDPIQEALDQDIPVIAYNANGKGPGTNPALAYVGQDLFQSGVEMGNRIVEIVDEGLVALFIATPGQLNIQPRIDGAKQAIEDSGANIEIQQVTTGAELPEERSRIEAWYNGHQDVAGMFAAMDDESGTSYDDMKGKIMGELKKVFRPEFLNRIDEVIVFHKLAKEEIKEIVDLLMMRVKAQVAEHGLQLELTEEAKDLLADKGWDPAMGARPLRRAIQRYIEDPLADEVLRAGEIASGTSVLVERNEAGDEDDLPLKLKLVKPKKRSRKKEPAGVGGRGGADEADGPADADAIPDPDES